MGEGQFEAPAVNLAARSLLDAYAVYRESLLYLYSRLRISDRYAGDPQRLFASILVANLLGGVAVPSSIKCGLLLTVIHPDGSCVGVECVDDREGISGAGLVFDPKNQAYDSFDWLALVAFKHARPVAVHMVPAVAIADIAAALCGETYGSRLPATFFTHVNLMLEPAVAAAYGVVTFDLLSTEGSASPASPA